VVYTEMYWKNQNEWNTLSYFSILPSSVGLLSQNVFLTVFKLPFTVRISRIRHSLGLLSVSGFRACLVRIVVPFVCSTLRFYIRLVTRFGALHLYAMLR
jgi:hypothetical protein